MTALLHIVVGLKSSVLATAEELADSVDAALITTDIEHSRYRASITIEWLVAAEVATE